MIKINNQIFADETFANGEVIYKEVTLSPRVNRLSFYFETNKDLADMIMAVAYIKSFYSSARLELFMPYIPYSRMDRKINEQLFSLGMFTDIINSLGFDRVIVLDPHSSTSESRIKNIEIVDIEDVIIQVASTHNIDAIMFPDKGARAKYTNRYTKLCNMYPIIFGEKKRDLANKGHILGYKIFGDEIDLTGKNILIVDDICCRGGTFYHSAKALKESGARDVYLCVTHCENTILDGELLTSGLIEKVYTTNSIFTKKHEKIEVFEV